MKKPILIVTALLSFCLFVNTSFAQTAPAAPAPTGNVVVAMTSSDDYTAMSIAVRAAGLTETLEGAGPYTVFAPTNEAFGKMSSTKLDSLMKDPTKFATALKFHVVSGTYTKADLIKALSAGKGKTTLKTLDGETLTLAVVSGKLQLSDEHGNTALVSHFDLTATNGVIHGLNAVLSAK